MNALAPVNAGLVPASMGEAMKLAEMMAGAKLVPQALQKSPADCLMVIQQAVRWQMDPFAVAQECSVIQGKLMHSGKLVAAVVNARGGLTERLSFVYEGSGQDRTIRVLGKLRGEDTPREVVVRLGDAKTNNRVWQTQPDQQLMYHGVRVWARRHTPELMLGVWSPEEFDEAAAAENGQPVIIDATPVSAPRKRTREEISAEANRKRQELRDAQKDIEQIDNLAALERYEREVLTPDFMASLGMKQYAVEEAFHRRKNELTAAPAEAEEIDAETGEITEFDAASLERAVDYSEALRNELIERMEAMETAGALLRMRDSTDFQSALKRLPDAMVTTIRRHGAALLKKLPTEPV